MILRKLYDECMMDPGGEGMRIDKRLTLIFAVFLFPLYGIMHKLMGTGFEQVTSVEITGRSAEKQAQKLKCHVSWRLQQLAQSPRALACKQALFLDAAR